MKTQKFGIEIETIGKGREAVAKAIQTVVGGTVRYAGGALDTWEVEDGQARVWRVMRDGSLNAPGHLQAEIASPVLGYNDLPILQEAVRAVRSAGARCDESCGIHYAEQVIMWSRRRPVALAWGFGVQEQHIISFRFG